MKITREGILSVPRAPRAASFAAARARVPRFYFSRRASPGHWRPPIPPYDR